MDQIKSAARTLEVLEFLASSAGPVAVGELWQELGYPRSSLHGLLKTLVRASWVEVAADGRVRLGIRAWETGRRYAPARDLAGAAAGIMEQAVHRLNETVQLAVLDGRHNVYIAKVDSQQRLALVSEVGMRLAAHATGVGKVLLAYVEQRDLDSRLSDVELEQYTPNTIIDHSTLYEELRTIRVRGYGFDREEYTLGVRCIAFPVRDASGGVVAAISVSVPSARATKALLSDITEALSRAGAELSTRLGYQTG